MEETYVEVPTEEYSEDFTFSDYFLMSFLTLLTCFIIGFVFKQIRITFKNVNLKVGNKVEVGLTTQEKEQQK